MASAAYCLLCRLLCIHQHFHLCAGVYCKIVENTFRAIVRTISQWKNTASERARERANTMVRAPTTANTEATKQKHNCRVRTPTAANAEATTQKHNCTVRTPNATTTETTIQTDHTLDKHSIFIRCHFGPMLVCLS